MGMLPAAPFQDYFAMLTEPRGPDAPNSRHQLMAILLMAVRAVLGGAAGWEDIAAYGMVHAKWCADRFDLPHGLPGHDTFRRGLSRLDPEEWTRCFSAWPKALSEASGGASVSIDGKTLRHAFARATGPAAIPMVRAWASANRLGWGQRTVEEKANAITAIPTLFTIWASAGAIGTSDAIGCQPERAKVMTDHDADYVLARKEPHPTLYEDVTQFFDEAQATACAELTPEYPDTVDGDQGRMATRRYGITSDIDSLGAKTSWAKWQSIGRVESCRAVGEKGQIATR